MVIHVDSLCVCMVTNRHVHLILDEEAELHLPDRSLLVLRIRVA
jgi:hypothetical protein